MAAKKANASKRRMPAKKTKASASPRKAAKPSVCAAQEPPAPKGALSGKAKGRTGAPRKAAKKKATKTTPSRRDAVSNDQVRYFDLAVAGRQTIVSLFSGAGGCSLGFSQAGLKPAFAAEIDTDACKTYRENLGVDCAPFDLSSADAPDRVANMVGKQSAWMVVGGPPCQGFSTAGPRSPSDPRNALIYNYLDMVERLNPAWFLFENVEGILTSNGGRDLVRLVRELIRLGYSLKIEKLNFAGYGLPQTRKRVVIVGNRLGLDFVFPVERFRFDSGKAVSIRRLPLSPTILNAIGDLPPPSNNRSALKYPIATGMFAFGESLRADAGTVRHHVSSVSESVRELAQALKPGQTMKDLPEEMQHASYRRRANRRVSDGTPTERRGGAPSGIKRLKADLNSLTITSASTREFIHPLEDRPLTHRECARLQSFPDAFCFVGNSSSIAKQIGNAIPPLAARLLAEQVQQVDGAAGSGRRQTKSVSAGLIGFRLTDASGMSPALAATERALKQLMSPDAFPFFETEFA